MNSDFETGRRLTAVFEEDPKAAPSATRVAVRARIRHTRQRPAWLVAERGDDYERRNRGQFRLFAIGVALVSVLIGSFAVGSFGERPQLRPVTPVLTAFPVEGQPLGVAVESGAVWIAMFDRLRVTRLDPATGATVDINTQGRNCVAASAGAGAFWVPSCVAGPLVRVDPATNTATPISFAGQGQIAAPVPFDGDIAWITFDIDQGEYVRYDARAGRELSEGQLPLPGAIVTTGFGSAWATVGARPDVPDELLRLDQETGQTTARIPISGGLAVTTDDAVWITAAGLGEDAGGLSRIDPSTNEVVASIDFESWDIRPATDGSVVWVLDGREPARLYRVDPSTNETEMVTVVGGFADSLAVDGDTIWVTRGPSRDVVRVELNR
ncbi:MAG: hypothetical protein M3253_04390 [Chloroflexota bacterium]|nr:hypothetical protein [Chloroflexota bacterium]